MNTSATFPASLNLPLVSVEKPKSLTYLGARAIVTVEHHDKSRVGLRTITTQWIDDATAENGGWPAGSVTRKTIKGDGRYVAGPKACEVIVPEALVA